MAPWLVRVLRQTGINVITRIMGLLLMALGIEYLKVGGQIITNTQEVDPMPVITGAAEYPADIVKKLEEAGAKVDAKDFLSIAEEAGSSKAVNIVLMGRLSEYFDDIPYEDWSAAIDAIVPEKFRELNHKAFDLGRQA